MSWKQSSSLLRRVLALIAGTLVFAVAAWAATGTVLYNFTGGKDGANPKARLLFDPKGNLYGTTTAGGSFGQGAVFELTPTSGGAWTESVIYSFQGRGDGSLPAAGLIRDKKGNFYGTVYMGGALGHGAVFELLPGSGGVWKKKLLYSFSGGNDGGQPVSGLIFDKKGNLFGTTDLDGADGQGVVFKLTPDTHGGWAESVLYTFTGQNGDGSGPGGSLVFDQAGNLYGLTVAGGIGNQGTVFELTPGSEGKWTESILYKFLGGQDGANPATSDLIVGPSGHLYGTTTNGGSAGFGTVFKLVHRKNGQWKESVLYTFPGGANGGNPYAGLVRDAAGNLYGTTASGVHGAGGVVFKLALVSGKWTENPALHF
jgi:uncharacterized repeat protein (TIGR03803 family)